MIASSAFASALRNADSMMPASGLDGASLPAFISSFCAEVAATSRSPSPRIRSSSCRAYGKAFTRGR
jgi:hypothetical protein